ncbi:hypothetical protein BGZ83_000687 [Gryganskiella cystojenkinii]|nr:hypothetical protein BGZ83_000687 [Gryganskiella cystojenkinii]
MMLFFLFFNAIIMINVLIALINVAFISADTTWNLVWQKTRLGYIHQAQIRHRHSIYGSLDDVYPQEIYYTVTPSERQAYEKRWREEEADLGTYDAYMSSKKEDEKAVTDAITQEMTPEKLVRKVESVEETFMTAAAVLAVPATIPRKDEESQSLKVKIAEMNGQMEQMMALLSRLVEGSGSLVISGSLSKTISDAKEDQTREE